ncbi:MAG TPA: response regulator transcription factor [Candidatus Elarobacter sp.]|nr:response regulator transcription factor [Candidatus Elarobacter sp.]
MSPSDVQADSAPTVLVVDDELQIRRALHRALDALPASVLEAATGAEGIDLAAAYQPDVVILDLGLPDMPGIEVCRAIRGWSRAPILVLSARRSEAEKVALLDAGADDYVVKPFGMDELTARVRVQLRRAEAQRGSREERVVRVGTLVIDLDARSVTRAGHRVHLTRIEWELLRTFVVHRGRTLTHRQLFDAVWRRAHGNAQQYLRVHLTNLRRKIEADPASPELIVTESGVGYRFAPDAGPEPSRDSMHR